MTRLKLFCSVYKSVFIQIKCRGTEMPAAPPVYYCWIAFEDPATWSMAVSLASPSLLSVTVCGLLLSFSLFRWKTFYTLNLSSVWLLMEMHCGSGRATGGTKRVCVGVGVGLGVWAGLKGYGDIEADCPDWFLLRTITACSSWPC